MGKVFPLILSLAAGIGLGFFYFGGLWLTVRRLPEVQRPTLLSLCSFIGRLGLTMVGFYFVMDGHWERLMICLLGFLAIRNLLVRWLGPGQDSLGLFRGEKHGNNP
ncbi:MAG: ATP synthase subunit I [Deltaproteobacteria bacterium]|nr:ATP synthase subunit I [Deltaproteobacteria bacterium]RLB93515.1 MAG: ATP synthase subunit I [Deltaproteobacteria bacterium]RLC10371.1 MAG: ATP synthase subunit I [Deltaproteobacteria bacterium]